uniref:protocadherin alpha-C2-like isoform X4 n=1 Tax=Pristiophorus japonicus TaxID=55135 RepID=UPI00398F5DC3
MNQIRYSIPEEQENGAFVGNIARDVGLGVRELSRRRFRIMSAAKKRYFEVNLEDGVLLVNDKIDREKLCAQSLTCLQNLEIVVENPLKLYRAEVEIQDINDNSPSFSQDELRLKILESTPPGTRFPLQSAHDPDVGTNSVYTYILSRNDHFTLDVQNSSEGTKSVYLLLEKYLDRETHAAHNLLLTAIDGAIPERSGSAQIIITVLDVNDNVPVFDQSVYWVKVVENVADNALVINLNATDLDEGTNADIIYSFSSYTPDRIRELFSVQQYTGEIRVKGVLDYEEANVYEINIEARDRGPTSVPVYCKVVVKIVDMNDVEPELTLMSLSSPVTENATSGTMVALISVTDPESGVNGKTSCNIPNNLPFQLKSSFKNSYMLVSNGLLDRETLSQYTVNVTCSDAGSPRLFANKVILVEISDINDNAPRFTKSSYTAYVMENNTPGASICSVTAFDSDLGQNSHISYSISESQIQGMPAMSFVSINSYNGKIFSQRSFDYEHSKNIQIHVQARDAGIPSLSSNVVVNVVILDQNDNSPVILSALTNNQSQVMVPRSAHPSYLVTKMTAVDADSGQNSRLFYELIQATDRSLFTVTHNSGEVRTMRLFEDRDSIIQVLVILVKDNGHPSLSTTVTVTFSLMDGAAETISDFSNLPQNIEHSSNVAMYIIIALASISFILLLIIIVLVTSICHNSKDNGHDRSLITCCIRRDIKNNVLKQSNANLRIPANSQLVANFLEVRGTGSLSETYCYQVRPASELQNRDRVCLTPFSSATRRSNSKNVDVYFSACNQQMKQSRNINNDVGQLNTDWRSSEPHIVGKISSQCLDENLTQDEVKQEFNRRHTAITSSADVDYIKASPDLEDGIPTWAPRFGSQHLENMEPDEYQSNIYMGGTPVMLSSKQDQLAKQDGQHSASSTKKKKKRSKRSEKRESKATNEEPQNE